MFQHHPELVETGELEIAQRAALNAAVESANRSAAILGAVDMRGAIGAYLAEMQRSWHPGPIVISEGDHIEVEAAGQRVDIHASDQGYYVAHPTP